MTQNCIKPIERETLQNDLSINLIMDAMLTNPKKIIQGHIQKFIDAGGMLQALSLSRRKDGTIILRTDERTIITVYIRIDGRKFISKKLNLSVEEDACL